MEMTGTVSSWVTAVPSVVAVVVTELPAVSVDTIEKTMAPSPSASTNVTAQVHTLLPPSLITSALVASVLSGTSTSQVGVWIVASAVNVMVTVSPSFVRVVTALLETMVTGVMLGLVVSRVYA